MSSLNCSRPLLFYQYPIIGNNQRIPAIKVTITPPHEPNPSDDKETYRPTQSFAADDIPKAREIAKVEDISISRDIFEIKYTQFPAEARTSQVGRANA
jgi:hypothetical protein